MEKEIKNLCEIIKNKLIENLRKRPYVRQSLLVQSINYELLTQGNILTIRFIFERTKVSPFRNKQSLLVVKDPLFQRTIRWAYKTEGGLLRKLDIFEKLRNFYFPELQAVAIEKKLGELMLEIVNNS